jgi:polyphosphate kinase 2 (PPK2 family)
MNFCTQQEYDEFMRSCPEFEKMLVRSGIILLKYWFSVSDEEQEKRFRDRATDPSKRWKLSPMDIASWNKWSEFSRAKDVMFEITDISQARWLDVEADDKKKARLNCMRHILNMIPYKDVTPPPMELPPRHIDEEYQRPPKSEYNHIPDYY